MKRALRRHHRERIRAKANRLVRRVWGYRDGSMDAWARKFAESIPVCFCWGCGMPRSYHGLTYQEKRDGLAGRDE